VKVSHLADVVLAHDLGDRHAGLGPA
jgi:hypothetical protein